MQVEGCRWKDVLHFCKRVGGSSGVKSVHFMWG